MSRRAEEEFKNSSNLKSGVLVSGNRKDTLLPSVHDSSNNDNDREDDGTICDDATEEQQQQEGGEPDASMIHKKVFPDSKKSVSEKAAKLTTVTVKGDVQEDSASPPRKKDRTSRVSFLHSCNEVLDSVPTIHQHQNLVAIAASQSSSKKQSRANVKRQSSSDTDSLNSDTMKDPPVAATASKKRKNSNKTCGNMRATHTSSASQQNRRVLPPRINRSAAYHNNIKTQQATPTMYVVPEDGETKGSANAIIAEDGNHFFCYVCSSTGDVICCDGCPKVYHAYCLPDGRSKETIDIDPWFCPNCLVDTIVKKKNKNNSLSRTLPTRELKRKSSETQQLHIKAKPSIPANPRRRATTWASMASFPGKCGSKPTLAPSARSWKTKKEKEEEEDCSLQGSNSSKAKSDNDNISTPPLTMKRKKIEQRHHDIQNSSREKTLDYSKKQSQIERNKNTIKISEVSMKRPVKAKPAFFFFLKENLKTLERKAIQKDRSFKAYSFGFARNRILATLGAKLWAKLSPEEKLRYTASSMQDFEQRVRDWKNRCQASNHYQNKDEFWFESNDYGAAREQQCQHQHSVTNEQEDDNSSNTSSCSIPMNIRQALEQAKVVPSLSIPTVEISSRREDCGENNILLDLLQDIRFHPLPMLVAKDHQRRYTSIDHISDFEDSIITNPHPQQQSITHFEVQGPVSTFIGDVCLGCSRGWSHFCPILKRQFPAVEHRGKLQPSLSSLVATRIGLKENDCAESKEELQQSFSSTSVEEEDDHNVLDFPDVRDDDIVHFLTHYTDLKVPKQLLINNIKADTADHTINTGRKKYKKAAAIEVKQSGLATTLPSAADGMNTARSSPTFTNGKASLTVYKCTCGNVTEFKEGCIKCRRSLLLSFMSKGQLSPSNMLIQGKRNEFLKLRTVMLPRMIRYSNFNRLKYGERAVAAVLSGDSWKPNAVMPHRETFQRPTYKSTSPHLFSSNCASQHEELLQSVPTRPSSLHDPSAAAAASTTVTTTKTSTRSLRSRKAHKQGQFKVGEKITCRQSILQRHKDEENIVQRKCLSIALCGVFLGLVRRDPQRIFADPVPESEIEYHRIVKRPMDFHTIREKILMNQYSFGTFVADVRLLCSNALAFNDPQSIYATTAQCILDGLDCMQQRASHWMSAIKNTLINSFHSSEIGDTDDPFAELRQSWPGAVELMEDVDWYRAQVCTDFVRTKENEAAYYGSLAIQRAATAAASSTFVRGLDDFFNPCVVRSATEDEQLRRIIDKQVAQLSDPMRRLDEPTWREKALLQLLRKVQSRIVENISSMSGCARCDGIGIGEKAKLVMAIEAKSKNNKQSGQVKPRIDVSRSACSTGLASMAVMAKCFRNEIVEPSSSAAEFSAAARKHLVSVRGSHIHGWGLFAEQPMLAGEVVAEYIGEYVSNAVADSREKNYQELRIQDYQFRVGPNLVIDATIKGGYARYINHCCDPNCVAQIIDGDYPQQYLKRVVVIAKRDIKSLEEITYDYKFPLEKDLDARIPCNCGAKLCRGFMNWDQPEKRRKVIELNRDSRKRREFGRVNSFTKNQRLKTSEI